MMVKQLKDNLNLQLHRRRKDWFVILCDKQPLPSVAVYKKLVYVGQAHRQVFLGGRVRSNKEMDQMIARSASL